jgi:hypothetical protein
VSGAAAQGHRADDDGGEGELGPATAEVDAAAGAADRSVKARAASRERMG